MVPDNAIFAYNKRVKVAPYGRWDRQKAAALYPYSYIAETQT